MSTVAEWLASLGLSEHAQLFADNRIDDTSFLPHLNDQDLKDLGIPFGHRRKMLAAIAQLAGASAQRVESQAAPAPEPKPQDTAERRQLTVMFCDLVGSTALSAKLDPEDLRSVIGAYHRCCAEVITKSGGFVAKYMGDGVLAYFGYPQAHEDDAERAVRAGLALVEAVPKLDGRGETALQVRVGIATGLVVVGDLLGEGAAQEQAVVGETPNLAARLQALAEPGAVVIASSTRGLTKGLFEYRDLGTVALKGFAANVPAWQVLGLGSAEGRFEALRTATTPLVGRDEEIELLLRRWDQAKRGDGQVVLISGEPGIGKSRIAQTLVEKISSEPHTRLRYFCSPHHQDSALYPSIAQLERAAGFRRDDAPDQRLAKLEAVLAQGANDLSEAVPLLADLLSVPTGDRYPPLNLSPQKRKERTLQAQLAQIEGLAARQPVLMVSEDLHWSDPTTRESLDLLVDRVATLRVLAVCTFRPEFLPPWVGRPHVTMLSLSRLPPRQRAEMITRVTGGKALPKEIAEQIVDRTDGVPLFIEEMTKSVVESGILADVGDRYTVSGPVAPLAIPTSLHASLLARLDRLAPTREIAQIGAALGRHFSHELISAVAAMPQQQLDSALAQLVGAELIFQRGTPPDAEYMFKHALVQDAAYDSMLKSKRAQLHSQIAGVLEARFTDRVASEPELLARHLTRAGLNERAVPYWMRAGQRDLERVAFPEAVAHLTEALNVNERLSASVKRDKEELQIRLQLASAYFAMLGWVAVEVPRTLRPARDLARRLSEDEKLTSILYYIWMHHSMRGEYETADSTAAELHSLARTTGDSRSLITAQMIDTIMCCWKGDFLGSRRASKEFAATYEPSVHGGLVHALSHDPMCLVETWTGVAVWSLGYPDQALLMILHQLKVARQLGHIWNLVFALTAGEGFTLILRGDADLLLEGCAEALAIGREHAIGVVEQILYPNWVGFSMIRRGEHEQGYAQLSPRALAWEASGALTLTPMGKVALAQACLDMGQIGQAELLARDAIELIDRTGHRTDEVDAYRVLGEALHARNDSEAAETTLLKAIEIAKSRQAKSWELRAATSLARIWQGQGKRTEARNLLAPVYDWFTEGFDTLDLKQAKALLEQLLA